MRHSRQRISRSSSLKAAGILAVPVLALCSGAALGTITAQRTFGLAKVDPAAYSTGEVIVSVDIEADADTEVLTFSQWRFDDFDTSDLGLNLQDGGPASAIADPAGNEFRFVSFTTEAFCGTPMTFDVVGYRDGIPVTGASQSYSVTANGGPVTRTVGFAAVDEVRFENYSAADGNQCLTLDDFIVNQAVVSNTQPSFASLDATVVYDEAAGTPVPIDTDATLADAELDAAGDYAGSTLTVERIGGADAGDDFGFAGGFTVSGGELLSGGNAFATYTDTGGTLTVDFTSAQTAATPGLVDDVLQGLTYANDSDPAVVEYSLSVTFNDGDAGGALSVSETVAAEVDPVLAPITAVTTQDFTALGADLPHGADVNARVIGEVLYHSFEFEDAAENSQVPSNGLRLRQRTADPATTAVRFENDAAFELVSLDIENFSTLAQDVTVYGYRDGVLQASRSLSLAAQSGYQTWQFAAVDAGFAAVDEVRLTTSDNDAVSIDNIVLGSSNTPPVLDLDTGDAGNGSTAAYSETDDQGSAPTAGVAVTGSVTASDPDGAVNSATLTFDNPRGDTGERLFVDQAALPAELGFTIAANQIIIERNTAGNADLVAAIEAVRYQNDSDAPDTTDRTVTVEITDNVGATTSATATVSVTAGNDVPAITNSPAGSVAEDAAYAYTPAVDDPDAGDTASFGISNAPAWASFDPATGALTGTPVNGDVGVYDNISITVTDSSGASDTAGPFSIQVTNANDAPTIGGTPPGTVAQDAAYSFTPAANDPDAGDTLTFSISNPPAWAVFNTATGMLSGTPGADAVGTYSGIEITVSDGMTGATLGPFSITVSNVNDAPVITNTPAGSVVEDTAYAYTPAVDDPDSGDSASFGISNAPAWASFDPVTGALTGTPAPADIGSYTGIEITVTDGGGLSDTVGPFSIAVTERDDPPTGVSSAPDIAINAGGLYTQVNLERNGSAPDASDEEDGALTPQPGDGQGTLRWLRPGTHVIEWSVTDSGGNTVTDDQLVEIRPRVAIGPDSTIQEGTTVGLPIELNGPAIGGTTPVVDFAAQAGGTADVSDHTLTTGTIVILAGKRANLGFDVLAGDAAGESEESLIVGLTGAADAVLADRRHSTITIVESNTVPRVRLSAHQSALPGPVAVVGQGSGPVTVTAEVQDANMPAGSGFAWNGAAIGLTDTDGAADDAGFTFNPAAVATGVYELHVAATDTGSPAATGHARLALRIVNVLPGLGSDDTDGDGSSDQVEGGSDADADGLPAYRDPYMDRNTLHESAGDAAGYRLETEAGLNLALGRVAFAADSDGAQVTAQQVSEELGTADSQNGAGVYHDVVIGELGMPGDTVALVLPQRAPVPAGARYRVYTAAGEWQDFTVDGSNGLSSAPGAAGYCPPPGDPVYTTGLAAGDNCVRLAVEDGGPNDADGSKDGRIVMTAGMGGSRNLATDLAVRQDFARNWAALGETVTVEVQIENRGVNPAQDTRYHGSFDTSGLRFLDPQISQGSCSIANGELACEAGTLPAGERITLRFRVRADRPGVYHHTAGVTASATDTMPGNDRSVTGFWAVRKVSVSTSGGGGGSTGGSLLVLLSGLLLVRVWRDRRATRR